MNAEYTVVWNGSKDHPGGRQLATDEEVRQPAGALPWPTPRRPLRPPSTLTDKERAQLIADVHATTYRAAAAKHGLTVATVQFIVGGQVKGQTWMRRERASQRRRADTPATTDLVVNVAVNGLLVQR